MYKRNVYFIKTLVYYVKEKLPHRKLFLALNLVSIYDYNIQRSVRKYVSGFMEFYSKLPRTKNQESTYKSSKHNLQYFFTYQQTCYRPRRTLFLYALSFECTSKLCVTFLNQFSVYFPISTMHYTI